MPKAEAHQAIVRIRPTQLLTALRMYYRDPAVPPGRVSFNVRGLSHPVVVRAQTTDMPVFGQVFFERQYDRLPVRDPRVIIDAGANIGLASLYFLRKYPHTHVIALEPDPENFEIAEENLRPYRKRCTLIPGALWSTRTRLSLSRGGGHWRTQVVAHSSNDKCEVEAYSLADLKAMFNLSVIDLLKIDIEGAETEVFRSGGAAVLDKVRCCAIELHGGECQATFFRPHGPTRSNSTTKENSPSRGDTRCDLGHSRSRE